jgi:hypothetical protein
LGGVGPGLFLCRLTVSALACNNEKAKKIKQATSGQKILSGTSQKRGRTVSHFIVMFNIRSSGHGS